jgi:hypothetical protein
MVSASAIAGVIINPSNATTIAIRGRWFITRFVVYHDV